jgi:hypothetical protein
LETWLYLEPFNRICLHKKGQLIVISRQVRETHEKRGSKRLHIYGQRGQGKLDLIQIDNIPPEYEPLVHAVRPFLDRVKTLRIRCDTVQAIGEFIYALRGTCNHLEDRTFRSVDDDIGDASPR